MKKFLIAGAGLVALATPALAADMAPAPVYTKAPPPPVVAVYNWTGFYIGANAGYAQGRANTSSVFDCPAGGGSCDLNFPQNLAVVSAQGTGSLNKGSFIGGGQAGYNWQASSFVFGLEGDVQGLDYSRSIFTSSGLPGSIATSNVSIGAKADWLATARARAGFLVTPQLLVYGTGGAAFTTFRVSNQFFETNFAPPETGLLEHEQINDGLDRRRRS